MREGPQLAFKPEDRQRTLASRLRRGSGFPLHCFAPSGRWTVSPSATSDRGSRLTVWDGLDQSGPFITPSLLACDFGRMRDVLDRIARIGVQAVHLDVMDGRFVPNLTYGPPVIARWREATHLVFDAHLMIVEPERWIDPFADAGCDTLVVHLEAVEQPGPVLERIKARGLRAGIAVNPPTLLRLDPVPSWLALLDSALVMSVMPGFGGQVFDPSVLSKVAALKQARPGLRVAIDGGIGPDTLAAAVATGVDQLVIGSAFFRADDQLEVAWSDLNQRLRQVNPSPLLGTRRRTDPL
jgi:ribulose-phosphate 3-epimerase